MITPMASVEIAGPLPLFDRTVEAVQESGLVHLEEIPLLDDPSRAALHRVRLTDEQERDRQSLQETLRLLDEGVARMAPELLARLRGAPGLAAEYRRWERESPATAFSTARVLHAKVRSQVRRERNLADDLQALSVYEEVAAALSPLVEGRSMPGELEFIGVVFEKETRAAAELLEQEVRALAAGECRCFRATLAGGRIAFLAGFPRGHAEGVRAFMERAGIAPLALPRYLRGKPFDEALAALAADIAVLRTRQQELAAQARRFSEESGLQLLALRDLCRDRAGRYEAYGKFARTTYTFLLRGWVAEADRERLAAILASTAGPAVLVRRVRPRGMGKPPVLLANPKPVGAFEPLLGFLPLPQYGSVDPTKFVATFFPPIFGMMLGDVGYGAILGLVAGILFAVGRRRQGSRGRTVRRLSAVLAACAFFTVVFGFVFGELFGGLGHELGLRALWMERFPDDIHELGGALLRYLALAVGVGCLQIVVGLVLGIVNARRFRDTEMAVGNLARIFGIVAALALLGRMAGVLPPAFLWVGLGGAFGFLCCMVLQVLRHPAHGLMLPLELLGTLGNILSYSRIMAIGMASVVLALLATILAQLMGNIVFKVLVIVAVHGLNLVLGTVDPTIQGLRLQYVEFFPRFLLTGGKRYAPFRKQGGVAA